MKLFVAIYNHPEFYPPTLNAVNELSKIFDKIFLLYRNYSKTHFNYPANIILLPSGNLLEMRKALKKNNFWKFLEFFKFTLKFALIANLKKIEMILVYDPIALFSLFLFRALINKDTLIWYHNHDVGDISIVRKYSIGWLAIKYEHKMFKYLNVFSLPAIERKDYFPMEQLKGKFFYLPNFPSKKFYSEYYKPKTIDKSPIRLVFQGSIGKRHGFEEILSILDKEILNKELNIILKGFISDEYKNYLISLAKEHSVDDKILFYGVGSYTSVLELASTCHIGIGIHTKTDIMNKTLGTSSNKIYEYAALGLPVLLFDNEHFRNHLSKYEWAFFTDLSKNSLMTCIENIIMNYEELSKSARKSFEDELNYEFYFKDLALHIKNIC